MKRLYFLLVLFLFCQFTLSACSSRQVITEPGCLLITVSKNISKININCTNNSYDEDLIKDLSRYLTEDLITAGFKIDEHSEGMTIDVKITDYSPGNAAFRLIIGFGAGRGSLIYTAKYISNDGRVLAELQAQERLTGGEPGFHQIYGSKVLGGADTARSILSQEAAKHIVGLALLR